MTVALALGSGSVCGEPSSAAAFPVGMGPGDDEESIMLKVATFATFFFFTFFHFRGWRRLLLYFY